MRIYLVIALMFIPILMSAGDKKLTFEQALMYGQPRLTKSMDEFLTWIDDGSFLLKRSYDGKNELIKYDAESGEEVILMSNYVKDEILYSSDDPDVLIDQSQPLIYKDKNLWMKCRERLIEAAARNKFDTPHFTKTTKFIESLIYEKSYQIKRVNGHDDYGMAEIEEVLIREIYDKNSTLSPDGKKVAYTRNNDLYYFDLEAGKEQRLTTDGNDSLMNGYASWIYYEEILGRSSKYKAFWWSPDSKKIAFLKTDDSQVPLFPLIKTRGRSREVEWQRYPKAGDPNPKVSMWVVNLETDEHVRMKTDPSKDEYICFPFWDEKSENFYFQKMNRGQDRLEFIRGDQKTGEIKRIAKILQFSWVEFLDQVTTLPGDEGFLFVNDLHGWRSIIHLNKDGELKRITDQRWPIEEILGYDEKEKKIYFLGTGENTTEQHLFSVGLDGKDMKKLTSEPGYHECKLSTDFTYMIDTYSSVDHPKKRYLVNLKTGDRKFLSTSATEHFEDYELGKVEMFEIPTKDGYNLKALWTLPPDFDPDKKYPIVFSVYGGPSVGVVKNRFRNRRGLFRDYYMAQEGIIVISVDNRGAGNHGKKASSEMHRNLGYYEMHDLFEAVDYIKKKDFIDTSKIGIIGGSYGGYVALMALTYGADYFTHGIAKYSVTDWQNYDNVYTERYMDMPKENKEGYYKANASNYVDKYVGKLLITHGTMDDNVHIQHTYEFIDAMELMGKEFELIIYPNERHGIRARHSHSMKADMDFWFRHFFGKELEW
jgi:dipeptidyl-peptidase-4